MTWDDDDHEIGEFDADLLGAGDEPADERVCHACGKRFVEQLEVCPHCGEWVTDEPAAALRSLGWFWPVAVGGLIAMIVLWWARRG